MVILLLLFLFAIIQTSGFTIAWGLLPFLLFDYKNLFKIKFCLPKMLPYFIIFGLLFSINFFAVYNFQKGIVEIPHPDYHFYLKIAHFFNTTGIENNYAVKTVLFKELNFCTPYRYFDTWLLSLMLFVFPFKGLVTLRLIYIPFIFFIASVAAYESIKNISSVIIKISISVFFVFLFGDYLSSILMNTSEISVVSCPKLALFFALFVYFITAQFDQTKRSKSILYLAILPILIQTAFPIYLFVLGYMFYYWKDYLHQKKIVITIALSMVYFVVFYGYNFYLSKQVFQIGQMNVVTSISQYIHRIISIVFRLISSKLICVFLPVTSIVILALTQFKIMKLYIRGLFLIFGIMLSGALVYAIFPSSPNSYQFLTNFTYPVVISFLFCLWIYSLSYFDKKSKSRQILIYTIISVFGITNQFLSKGFFNSLGYYDGLSNQKFVQQTYKMLNESSNKQGLTYWSNKNSSRNITEHFDQYGTLFLMQFDGVYDVVCLSGHELNDSSSNKVSKYYSAIATFQRLYNVPDELLQQRFYSLYKFGFLITDLGINELPKFIKKDIKRKTYDVNSKVFCYKLN
jgi:hypothetical protein